MILQLTPKIQTIQKYEFLMTINDLKPMMFTTCNKHYNCKMYVMQRSSAIFITTACFLYKNFVTAGYLSRITLLTRITDHSATLLDNIFTNVLEEHTSGVIICSISDLQLIYTYKNVEIQHTKSCINRYIEIERNDPHSIQNFVTKFQDFNLQK